jgi:protein-L-isoaspartate(D-aspartate) O-methyltransferase
MVEQQLARRGIGDGRVLAAMREVPRELFVPERLRRSACGDGPLPIGDGQTISQPWVVAEMLQAAAIGPGDRVLDVGTGSGYAAAVASRLAAEVYTVERHASLAHRTRAAFERLGYVNIATRIGDGTLGWSDGAPFDTILVAAGGPEVPQAYCRQLAIRGRLVMPVGPALRQRLVRVIRRGEDAYDEADLGAVAFVPLVGALGWADDDAPRRVQGRSARERPSGEAHERGRAPTYT